MQHFILVMLVGFGFGVVFTFACIYFSAEFWLRKLGGIVFTSWESQKFSIYDKYKGLVEDLNVAYKGLNAIRSPHPSQHLRPNFFGNDWDRMITRSQNKVCEVHNAIDFFKAVMLLAGEGKQLETAIRRHDIPPSQQ